MTNQKNEHIPLHRLWGFTKLQLELLVEEVDHIAECEVCRLTLLGCLHAENFASVLKTKEPGND